MPVIAQVDNAHYADGLRLLLTLTAAPTGTLRVYAAPRPELLLGPDYQDYEKTITALAGTAYAVQVRDGVTEYPLNLRGGYYLLAEDDTGKSELASEWLCARTNESLASQVTEQVLTVLTANGLLLERAVQTALGTETFPGGKEIGDFLRFGRGPLNYDADPHFGVNVLLSARQEDHYAVPFSDKLDFSLQIRAYCLYQSEAPLDRVALALGEAVWSVLNQPHYLIQALPGGMKMYEAFCRSANLNYAAIEGSRSRLVSYDINYEAFVHAQVWGGSPG